MHRLLIPFVSLLLLASCGGGSDTFHLEGRLMKIRQAEFFIYSTDGGISGRDTIKVMDGRFAYDILLDEEKTFILVFPNFSEQPIFAKPGAEVTISGSASQLREMEIEGTDDNELYTDFRLETLDKTDGEVRTAAEAFIAEHPKSRVCRYLIDRYFIKTQQPDYQKALQLVDVVLANDSTNARFAFLKRQLEVLLPGGVGTKIPPFAVRTVTGDTVTNDSLRALVNVINVYAPWNTAGQTILGVLKRQKDSYGDSIAVMSICLDADSMKCLKNVKDEKRGIYYVCDKKLWDSPLLKTLGIATMPGNIIADEKGSIIAINLSSKEIGDRLKEILKKE